MRRNSNYRKRNSRRRGIAMLKPQSIRTISYSGEIAGLGTLAFTALMPDKVIYRIGHVRCQYVSEKPSSFQLSLADGLDEISNVSAVLITSPSIRSLKLKQPRSTDWQQGKGSPAHVAWINNLGANPIRYNFTATVTVRDYLKPQTFNNVSEIEL